MKILPIHFSCSTLFITTSFILFQVQRKHVFSFCISSLEMLRSKMKSPSFYIFSLLVFTAGCNAETQSHSDYEKTLNLPPVTQTGAIQQLFDPPSAGGLDFNFSNLFTSFINQTRSTIPKIAHHGNFTLLQLSLLGAVGAMAAGIATIVAEGKYFKEQADEAAEHNGHYGPPGYYKRQDNAAKINYDLPNSISNDVRSPYGSQQVLNPYFYQDGNQDLSRRNKRDVSFPSANNSTEESHRPLRKRIKKKKIIEATQENYAVQPSQSYEIPYEMFNSESNYISSDNQITPTQAPYYITVNNTSSSENKNKSKSAKVLTSGKYNFPKGTEKNEYYVNLEQQNSSPVVNNGEYDSNYYQQFISSQQSSNTQTDSQINQNSGTDTQSNYVNLVDSDANYRPSQQNPSADIEYFAPQNNQQIPSNFPGNYYQSSNGPADNSNSNSAGQSNTNQLYYRNQSQNSANPNDNYYYTYNNGQVPSGVVGDGLVTAPPNPSLSQAVNSQNQYQNFQQQSSDQQIQTQLQQQYPLQQPPTHYPQQQYPQQQPQQQSPQQQPQQQYPQQPRQQYPQQPQQQYPQQPQQQYPQQPQQQYPQQQFQPQQQYQDQSQQQIQSSQQYQVQQSQQSPTEIQKQSQEQYPNQQPQQLEESYLQQMQPPLPPNSQNPQFQSQSQVYEFIPPRKYYEEKSTSAVRFPVQQPTQNSYRKTNNRNGQVTGQSPYYMNRPYSNVNSNKRISYKNHVLPSIPETTAQSLLSRIFNPFGLSFPPKNKKSNFITRSFQQLNRVKRVN